MTIPEEIERLKTQLTQATDELDEAAIILELVGRYAISGIIDSVFKSYVDRLLKLSEKLKSNLYRAWGLHYLAILNRFTGKYEISMNLSQEAGTLFEQIKNLEGLAKVYTNIGFICLDQGKYTEALKYHLQALEITTQMGNPRGISSTCNNVGNIYEKQGNYPEALKYHLKALKIREEIGDKRLIASSYVSVGHILHYQGNYPEALKNYFQALQMQEEIGDKQLMATAYNNIAIIDEHQRNYHEALKNNFKALELLEEIGDKKQIATTCDNIGIIYQTQGKYPQALESHMQSLRIREEINDSPGMAFSFNYIGSIHAHEGNYSQALKSHLQALQIAKEIGTKLTIASCYTAVGEVYEKQGNHTEALKNELLAFQLSQEIGHKELIKESALLLFNIYRAINDFENALKYHEKYHQTESEMLGEQAQKQLTDLNFMHNMEQKEKEAVFEKQKREEAERFRKIVEAKNTEIVQSINYAAKIQNAILPPLDSMNRYLPDSFVLHISKDIVSGDFYFMEASGDYLYFAVVDCTGHGVPGAMVSIVGHAGLKRAIDEFRLTEPAEILLKLNELVTGTLHQSADEDTLSDGMDIAFCRLDIKNNQLLYAGANRPLWLFSDGELIEYKPTKTAIGGMKYEQDRNKSFMQQEIKLQAGDTFYIFSDGYADQFGGENGKKMMVKKFKETLHSIQSKTMPEQKNYLNECFQEWKGEHEQVDDVLVIGIRV